MGKYPFSLDMFGLEAKVRGLYLTLACDFEKVMVETIALCEEPDDSKRQAFMIKMPFEMGKKLKMFKKSVMKYNKSYYNHFLPQFKIIGELVKYRNMLAHGFSQYDTNKSDKSFIIFEWQHKGKLKSDRIEVKPFMNKILDYRIHIGLIYTLHAKIAEER